MFMTERAAELVTTGRIKYYDVLQQFEVSHFAFSHIFGPNLKIFIAICIKMNGFRLKKRHLSSKINDFSRIRGYHGRDPTKTQISSYSNVKFIQNTNPKMTEMFRCFKDFLCFPHFSVSRFHFLFFSFTKNEKTKDARRYIGRPF